ncbi:MAG: 50S ribosomal protein L18e [Nanoarchaeota archaeon]|nr:50S ribosomal protein L18e [Nanoarchaeota archaeon]MBU4242077.1 50S ribosomal protein L18e [Nanoarchaeota archaeon]MBU4351999.1 50S ribosomal protein L18e [Nanoarchaeota archaeon]MBU4455962.1 50S ribosomal protein L18e [Nanoarchaeota archaeon]MCG2720317.1 50S ribosomal protein L18e [Nanoarchaeota archaeon]
MVKRTGPTNVQLQKLIVELKKLSTKEKVAIWKRVANELSKSTRSRRSLNLSKVQKVAKDNETLLVPGKVLSSGELTKKVTLAAWQFSEQAKEKINKVGKAVSIQDLMKSNPKGKSVRILG